MGKDITFDKQHVVIAGGSGFVGTLLTQKLLEADVPVVHLTTHHSKVRSSEHFRSVFWDPYNGEVPEVFGQMRTLINLCGIPIEKNWSRRYKEKITRSRVIPTRLLGNALNERGIKGIHMINASAMGFYGDRPGEVLTESSLMGEGFLAESTTAWENEAIHIASQGVMVTICRFGIVFDKHGGFFKKMKPFIKTGLFPVMGTGEQHISWIDLDDLCNGLLWVLQHKLTGIYNMTSPHPVKQKSSVRNLRESGKPLFPEFKVPAFILKFMIGGRSALVLDDIQAYPERLLDSGFEFQIIDFQQMAKKLQT